MSGRLTYAVKRCGAIKDANAGDASRLHILLVALRIIISQHVRLKEEMSWRPNIEQLVAAVAAVEAGFRERAQTFLRSHDRRWVRCQPVAEVRPARARLPRPT